MKLRKLLVHRMPGFEQGGFTLEPFGHGVTVIVGPNASGKTTACRAIRGLLWPESLKDAGWPVLDSTWEDAIGPLELKLEGSTRMCQRAGQPSSHAPLPPDHLADCFTVTVGDLFDETDVDKDLASQLAREMAGGFDLNALRTMDQFRIAPSLGRTEATALRGAREHVSTVESEQRALRAQEQELAQLQKQQRDANAAQARLKSVEHAGELLQVRDDIVQVQSALEGHPRGMEHITGQELEQLEQIEQDLDDAQSELSQAQQNLEEAEDQIAAADLPEGGIPEATVREYATRVEQLRDVERELDDLSRRSVQTHAQRTTAATQLRGEKLSQDAADVAADITLPDVALRDSELNEVTDFQRRWEETQGQDRALRVRLQTLEQAESAAGAAPDPPDPPDEPEPDADKPPADTTTLVNGIQLLRQWFEVGSVPESPGSGLRTLSWAVAALLAVMGVALAAVVHPLWLLLLLPAGLVAVGAAVLDRPPKYDRRAELQEQYQRLSLPVPEYWDHETVGKLLSALEADLARARQADRDSDERKRIQAGLTQIAPQIEALESERAEYIERLGAAPDSSPLALVVLAERLYRYQEALAEAESCRQEADYLGGQRRELLERINSYLSEYGAGPADDYPSAAQQVSAVATRAEQYRQATAHAASAQHQVEYAQSRCEELRERRRQVYEQAELEDGDLAGLTTRIEALDAYRKDTERLRLLEADKERLQTQLEAHPEMLEWSREQLESEAGRLHDIIFQHEEVSERIGAIRESCDRARRASDLEDALAQEDGAFARLEQKYEEAVSAAVATALLDQVQAEYEAESQPAVLRQASEWLVRFTRGRYELRLQDGGPSDQVRFYGHDTVRKMDLSLEQLSGGTRMQLLLAARLAFAAAAEHKMKLPFVLDEVLITSDPVRFAAIIECVLDMVRDGRQVLYFTCRPSDLAAWQQMGGQDGQQDIGPISHIDMPGPHGGDGEQPAGAAHLPSAIEIEPIPEPAGRTLEQYIADLDIPPLEPAKGSGGAHVAHLVTSAEALYQLLSARIEMFGQVKSLIATGGARSYIGAEQLKQMQWRAAVLDAFAELHETYRGLPLTRQVLEDAGVSPVFIDRVTDLAADLRWDAVRVMDALKSREDERAQGFRDATRQSMEEYLLAEGYLPAHEEPLAEDTAWTYILSAVSEWVDHDVTTVEQIRELFQWLWAISALDE
jgi:uncharacterized protein YhaN